MESNGKDQQNEEIIEETLEENTEEQVESNKRKKNDEENHENERERVKRKRTESKEFKRILRELKNEAYKMEVEEENDNEKLSERVLSMERKTIKYCYEIGKDVTNEVQRIKEQEKGKMKERKKKNGRTVEDISKKILIDEIMEEIGNSVKRKIIENRIRRAERIYNLFRKIGENKMRRIIENSLNKELIIERITCKLRIEEADILIKEIGNYYESSKGEIVQEKKSEDKKEKDYGKGKRRIIQYGELEECYKNVNIYYCKKCGFKEKAKKWIRKQRNGKFMCCNIESSKSKEKGKLKKINNLGIYECFNNSKYLEKGNNVKNQYWVCDLCMNIVIGGKKQRGKHENRNSETTSICTDNREILGIFDDHKDHNHMYTEIEEVLEIMDKNKNEIDKENESVKIDEEERISKEQEDYLIMNIFDQCNYIQNQELIKKITKGFNKLNETIEKEFLMLKEQQERQQE
ncbi:hypothetical protein C1645_816073 [Glomus cerebriforme]|uniref:Uncharacterized protein n=1 Tax=Glomus cerebriforme TaxID=658196 RepID=A0A397TCD4_9GLOM|nr:hypothetical protein C1645_816073 [Glomus cerebriforme]